MILEMLILSSGVAVWNKISPSPKGTKKQQSTKQEKKKPARPLRSKQLLRDIRRALKDEGCGSFNSILTY